MWRRSGKTSAASRLVTIGDDSCGLKAATPRVNRSQAWCRRQCSSTLNGTDSIRQAGCMAKTEKKPTKRRLPQQITDTLGAIDDKKGLDVVVLDLRKAAGFTDFFVIASGTNSRQIRAIADAVMEKLAGEGAKPAHVEGYDRSEWILLDYFDFIVHVFATETRMFYGLERLWGNADRIEVAANP